MKVSADQAIGFTTTDGSSINGGPIEPFLKWAGGKRWAVPRLLAEAPTDFDRYIEPFLGGGSLFFALRPTRAILADVNGELINAYERVRDQADQIQRQLLRLESIHSKELYYAVRSRQGHGNLWRAVRFIYLNRTCWNGLYRVNTRGEFNVPSRRTNAAICSFLRLSAQCIRNRIKNIGQIQPKRRERDDARQRDESGDQAVLYGRGALLVVR